MVEDRKYDIDATVKKQIADRVDLLMEGQENNFPLSVNPDLVTPPTAKIPSKYICYICKRVPLDHSQDKNCKQYFCVTCLENHLLTRKKCPAC